jgi:hypothetical protein
VADAGCCKAGNHADNVGPCACQVRIRVVQRIRLQVRENIAEIIGARPNDIKRIGISLSTAKMGEVGIALLDQAERRRRQDG